MIWCNVNQGGMVWSNSLDHRWIPGPACENHKSGCSDMVERLEMPYVMVTELLRTRSNRPRVKVGGPPTVANTQKQFWRGSRDHVGFAFFNSFGAGNSICPPCGKSHLVVFLSKYRSLWVWNGTMGHVVGFDFPPRVSMEEFLFDSIVVRQRVIGDVPTVKVPS